MKHLLAAILLPSILLAQTAQPVPVQSSQPAPFVGTPLSDNYQVTLVMTDKDNQPFELSVVVAATRFVADFGDQHLSFKGSLNVEDSGSLIVAYAITWETEMPGNNAVQFRSSSAQGSVRLKSGEEMQIIRSGPRVARLSVKKIEPSKSK